MNFRDAAKKMIDVIGGWDAAAGLLGMSAGRLNNRVYSRRGQSLNHDQMMQLQASSGTSAYAEAVAAESGGTFVPHQISAMTDDELQKELGEVMADCGHYVCDVVAATADGVIDAAELKRIANDRDVCHAAIEKVFQMLAEKCKRDLMRRAGNVD